MSPPNRKGVGTNLVCLAGLDGFFMNQSAKTNLVLFNQLLYITYLPELNSFEENIASSQLKNQLTLISVQCSSLKGSAPVND